MRDSPGSRSNVQRPAAFVPSRAGFVASLALDDVAWNASFTYGRRVRRVEEHLGVRLVLREEQLLAPSSQICTGPWKLSVPSIVGAPRRAIPARSSGGAGRADRPVASP